ncbi:PQQ-dependent sugar dehydrogenase [Chitinispirillales bacterium ANBcel5]|uniref:PQQ-dependent sugar dehydrogenase n=1 Tax=Cellulosispirillum alkaliphilum TaxID=3039283 RepID=UPI002A587F55|nr:PQQ-dependent sugar dehydrogenase [Chitinispirillales bacterium ANBcel5]
MKQKKITRTQLVSGLLLLFIGNCSFNNSENANQNTVTVTDIATGLEIPWAIDFLPDGSMIFTQRPGEVKLQRDNTTELIGQIDVIHQGEAGLLGVAVDPDFNENNYIYLYYTYQQQAMFNRISRFTLNGSLSDEFIVLDSIDGANIHNGGRIKFGPDGLLYATTGDANDPSLSADTNSLAGKILRMEKDGSVPGDNPFGNYVYALGLRNPQGLAWRDDTLYASSHGPVRRDELHRIERGMDYGWPEPCDQTGLAFRCYTEFTLAPSGIAIYENMLLVTGLRGNQLRRVDLQSDQEFEHLTELGRLREVVLYEGYLYIATSNRDGRGTPQPNDDRIVKVDPNALIHN